MRDEMKSNLSPENVSAVMNFDAANPQWLYSNGEESMAARQAEGVAHLWNILAKQHLALLADEVGMGKTYQAIGLMLMLWRQRPDAKILVMAPNKILCHNWENEFAIFADKHYRAGQSPDFAAKKESDYQPTFIGRIEDLADDIAKGSRRFYLTTIHALSGMVRDKDQSDMRGAAKKMGNTFRQQITSVLQGGFDLVIIDEAHYFRNRTGYSQRAAAAQAFFGGPEGRLSKRTLLLTATPNHSAARNIYDIFSYFTVFSEQVNPNDVRSLMQKYAIRRLRKMQGKGGNFSKYHYRRESAVQASFDDQQDAELFFALYQKKLVEEQQNSGRAFMYGYLEGFESTGSRLSDQVGGEEEEDFINDDFHLAPDSRLLRTLTRQFNEIYHRFPDHPKYDALTASCLANPVFGSDTPLDNFKHLVFVRRIPSVREITQRLNARYDEMLAKRILDAWKIPEALDSWRRKGWSRAEFSRLIQGKMKHNDSEIDLGGDDSELQNEPGHEPKLSSKIAELFMEKKAGHRRTDCTNVSLRFRRPESLFSLFLEPALDGKTAGYFFFYHRQDSGRDTYSDAARDARMMGPLPARPQQIPYGTSLTTAWGMIYRYLPVAAKDKIEEWLSRADGAAVLENFATYLRTGYIFASPVMTELYCWYTEFSQQTHEGDAKQRYREFTRWVDAKLSDSLMLRYFIAAIETFETLCEKIAGKSLADTTYGWRELTGLNNPAWYASGQSSNRERLIVGFNSPFYPNVLVATSVFQEGVNLHLQCHQVHHYGIAWTPGANEQRNGRVDRLYGKVNSLLQQEESAEMSISYPYLEGTFDQDQLASFIRMKYAVEEKLDSCEIPDVTSEIDLNEDTRGWEKWLRAPNREEVKADPYPARFSSEKENQ